MTTVELPLRPIAAPSTDTVRKMARPLLIASAASISAGAIHAGAIGAHAEHPQTAKTFAVVALVQVGWGVLALLRPTRRIALLGTALSGVLFISWVAAKMRGLPFIDGLGDKEAPQFADTLCAALALTSSIAAAKVAFWFRPMKPRPMLATTTAAVLVALALPGMVEAGNHVHSHGSTGTVGRRRCGRQGAGGDRDRGCADPPVRPEPADRSQRCARRDARAAGTRREPRRRSRWSGCRSGPTRPRPRRPASKSIGDAVTGDEHLINWGFINDDHVLDPDHPESLVYNVRSGHRELESAMFMLPPGSSLDKVPDIGGALTQWHIHNNLCFTNDPVCTARRRTDGWQRQLPSADRQARAGADDPRVDHEEPRAGRSPRSKVSAPDRSCRARSRTATTCTVRPAAASEAADLAIWRALPTLGCGQRTPDAGGTYRSTICRSSDADYQQLLEFRDGLRRFLHWSETQATAAGLTPAQHQLLLAVRGHGGRRRPDDR